MILMRHPDVVLMAVLKLFGRQELSVAANL